MYFLEVSTVHVCVRTFGFEVFEGTGSWWVAFLNNNEVFKHGNVLSDLAA